MIAKLALPLAFLALFYHFQGMQRFIGTQRGRASWIALAQALIVTAAVAFGVWIGEQLS